MNSTYIVTCDDLCAIVKVEGDRYPSTFEIEDALAHPMAHLMNAMSSQISKGFGLGTTNTVTHTSSSVTNAVKSAISTKGAQAYKIDTTCDVKNYK